MLAAYFGNPIIAGALFTLTFLSAIYFYRDNTTIIRLSTVAFVTTGVMLAMYLDNQMITAGLCILALLSTTYFHRHNPNIVHLCVIVIALVVTERLVFLFIPTDTAVEGDPIVWVLNRIYLVHLLFDITAFVLVMYRGRITRWYNKRQGRETTGINLTLADAGILLVILLFTLVDLSAAVENLTRNLEHLYKFDINLYFWTYHFGWTLEEAKPYWDYTYIFNNYTDFKHWLLGVQVLAVSFMASKVAARRAFKA